MERFNFSGAELFELQAKVVTLDEILDKAPRFAARFQELSTSYEDELASWSAREGADSYGSYPKTSLLEMIKRAGGEARASTAKADLITELVRLKWQKTETFQAFGKVRKANEQLQGWADEVQDLPKVLQRIVAGADEAYEQLMSRAKDVHSLVSELRFHAGSIMNLAGASRLAKKALRMIENDTPFATVIRGLVEDCNLQTRSVIAQNMAPSGHGLDEAAKLGSAKIIADEIRHMLPRSERYLFLA
ncbi:hypothetical protein ACIOHC_36360 [Streptomyces sp. NPDC088252]|uniref:hypothetical protein n=1 Tax=Streptomyces sp. NPDC088252 TaxID=3365845 RepID=UPI0037FF8599